MPAVLALLLCCAFVVWLFREDMKWRRLESGALWIAGIWVAIAGSRSPIYWTAYFGLGGMSSSNLEGSPVNFLITTVLIISALLVLRRRQFHWGSFVQENKALFSILIFFAASALWAEYPSVVLRRVFKDFGAVPVALLLLTQKDPAAAIRTIYVRVSFLLFSFSVLFYKYFPELGRTYSRGGEPLFAGVCTFKNELGQMVMVFGLILLWDFLELRKEENSAVKRRQVIIHCGCLLMGAWLLLASHSVTSQVCLVLGSLVFFMGGYLARFRSPGQVVLSILGVAFCLLTINAIFQPSQIILEALDRNQTLTGRADAWPAMIESSKNSLVGSGYRLFFDLAGDEIRAKTGFPYTTAHNGYVETYLSGGLLGLVLLGFFLVASGFRAAAGLIQGGHFGRFGLVFWIVLLFYNWSESCFLWGGSLWFTFLLWAVKPPPILSSTVVSPSMQSDSSSVSTEEAEEVPSLRLRSVRTS